MSFGVDFVLYLSGAQGARCSRAQTCNFYSEMVGIGLLKIKGLAPGLAPGLDNLHVRIDTRNGTRKWRFSQDIENECT